MLGLALSGAAHCWTYDTGFWVLELQGLFCTSFPSPLPNLTPTAGADDANYFVEVAHAKYAQSDTSALATYFLCSPLAYMHCLLVVLDV